MLYKYLPYSVFKRLFGDRKQFGTRTNYDDEDFKKWKKNDMQFYQDNQKGSIGGVVNHFGFKIVGQIDFTDKIILEVGPGIIEHLDYNATRPKKYLLADINSDFLNASAERLKGYGIRNIEKIKIENIFIPLEDNSVDLILTFHQLEHIYQLGDYVKELKRVLRPNGLLVGAVPCEGGMGWGLGRCLTSRRYVRKKMDFNYDKIICWEHPNFVDRIQQLLNLEFEKVFSVKKPFHFLPLDLNLSWSFVYVNRKNECI